MAHLANAISGLLVNPDLEIETNDELSGAVEDVRTNVESLIDYEQMLRKSEHNASIWKTDPGD